MLDVLVGVSEKVVKGEELLDLGEVCNECGKVKKFLVERELKCGHKH